MYVHNKIVKMVIFEIVSKYGLYNYCDVSQMPTRGTPMLRRIRQELKARPAEKNIEDNRRTIHNQLTQQQRLGIPVRRCCLGELS